MEDQPADPGDLTTGTPRRRWGFGRRRAAAPATDDAAEVVGDDAAEAVSEEPAETPRVPTGKAGRKAAVEVAGAAGEGSDVEQSEEGSALEESDSGESDGGAPDSDVPDGEVPEADVAEAESDATDADAADAGTTDESEVADADADPAEAEAPVLVPHREAGRRLTYAAAGAGVLFVVACGFGGAALQPYLADRALVETKLEVARTSASAITTLWTYNPDNIETLPDRAEVFLSDDFATDYRQFIDTIAPSNKQAQVTNNTEVMGAAVESLNRDEATAIVYTNTVSTSPITKNVPSLRYLSFRLTLHRSDGDWRITQMPTLTQLDLTPQL